MTSKREPTSERVRALMTPENRERCAPGPGEREELLEHLTKSGKLKLPPRRARPGSRGGALAAVLLAFGSGCGQLELEASRGLQQDLRKFVQASQPAPGIPADEHRKLADALERTAEELVKAHE